MDLELRHLRLVAAVAELGSVTRAGERLHLTQSALSHQLRDVESRLGAALFLRVGKRMVLTPAGRRVLETAGDVLEAMTRAEADVKRLAEGGAGEIRVATQCNTGYHWLPPLLKSYRRKHPAVDVAIVVEATDRPVEHLLAGKLDLAIVTDAVEDRRVRIRPLFRDEMVALVARDHPFASRSWVAVEDLAREHLLLYASDPRESFTITRVLEPAGVTAARTSFIMLSEAIVEMAKAGLGVGVMARWSAQPAIESKALTAVSLGRRGAFRQWSAVTIESRGEPAYLRDFMDLLAERALPAMAARTRASA